METQTNAVNRPILRAKKEVCTADMPIGQKPDISLGEDFKHGNDILKCDGMDIQGEYLEQLKFMEEPVTIRIERSSEKFAPNVVDCWVNGVGAEVFERGRWFSFGYLPVGQVITTKRKYVEVLARAKPDSIETTVIERDNEDPENKVQRFTHAKYPFSVIRDENPRGYEWLTRVMAAH